MDQVKVGKFLAQLRKEQGLTQEALGVSVNELLAGGHLSGQRFRKLADENIVAMARESAFAVKERGEFLRKMAEGAYGIYYPILGAVHAGNGLAKGRLGDCGFRPTAG